MARAACITSTIPATVLIRRVITPDTDPRAADHAVACSGVTWSWHSDQDGDGVLATRDTIRTVVTALGEHGAVSVLCEDAKRDVTARIRYPMAVLLTEELYIACEAHCTDRPEVRTFPA